jgi:hypothetical protein
LTGTEKGHRQGEDDKKDAEDYFAEHAPR